MTAQPLNATTKKPGIRPGLLIALLAIVAATVWSLMQDDDTDVRSAKGARGKSGARTEQRVSSDVPADARSLRSARAAVGSTASADSNSGAGTSAALKSLSQQVALWQARGAFEPLGEAGNAAWASKLPPPPPPPKQEPPPPPPPPTAPPFPYQWIGRWQEMSPTSAGVSASSASAAASKGAPSVDLAVIAGPNQTWVVKAGDVIEGQWRIDAVTERSVQLTYLPLSQTQTITMRRT